MPTVRTVTYCTSCEDNSTVATAESPCALLARMNEGTPRSPCRSPLRNTRTDTPATRDTEPGNLSPRQGRIVLAIDFRYSDGRLGQQSTDSLEIPNDYEARPSTELERLRPAHAPSRRIGDPKVSTSTIQWALRLRPTGGDIMTLRARQSLFFLLGQAPISLCHPGRFYFYCALPHRRTSNVPWICGEEAQGGRRADPRCLFSPSSSQGPSIRV